MRFSFPYTARQELMIRHQARILHLGCATKTGKSMALYCWLVEGLLAGQATCYCGPWFFRSRRAFDEVKLLLQPFIASRQVRVNEARLQLTATGGGYLDFVSGDNANAAFGGNYDRLVIDEASRQPREIFTAGLTTISATNGKLRLAFNLELGSKNWAIANLLRVQRLSPEERIQAGEDFLTFPAGGDGLVAPALIELMRSKMPEALWLALYRAEIPESDCSLFRNLDKIFTGQELEGPVFGAEYFLAADVARKKDWSVLTVIDDRGRVVAMDRFHQISWTLQVERAALWYRTFGCRKVIVDATGVGDVVAEEFEKAGMNVEAFIFTVPSRRLLVEELVLACDNSEIILPATEKFKVYREELESMEYQLDGTSIKYAVPSGSHDDALFSLALATHVYRASRGWVLGVLDMLKRTAKEIAEGVRDKFGELIHKPAAPKLVTGPKATDEASAVIVTRDQWREWCDKNKAPACPHPECGSTATSILAGKIHCNDCGRENGEDVPDPARCMCEKPLLVQVGGHWHCNQCGWDEPQDPRIPVNGARRTQRDEQSSLLSAEKFGLGWGRFRRSGRG